MSRTEAVEGVALRTSLGAVIALRRALQEPPLSEPVRSPGEREEECIAPSFWAWHDFLRWSIASLRTATVVAEKGVRLLGVEEWEAGRVVLELLHLTRFMVKVPLAVLAAWECEHADYDAV